MFVTASLEEALEELGALLDDRGHAFDVVAVGGGALLLLGVLERPTKDLDLIALLQSGEVVQLARDLPPALGEAVRDVGRVLALPDDWLNSGPRSLLEFGLPEGFLDRLERRTFGALGVCLASRFDQIHFKLYAAADDRPRGKHHVDLQHLTPTRDELVSAARWARTHDPSDGFALMLRGVLRSFGIEDDVS